MNPNVLQHFGRPLPVAPSFQRNARFMGAPRRPMLGQDFPAITEELRKRGAVLPVQVGIPSSLAAQMTAQGQTPPPPEEIQALVDTGASVTAIDVATAQRLGLPITGSIKIGHAGGTSDQPVYSALFRLPDPFVEWDPMMITGAQLSGTPFQILIGRNVLCSMTLSYDGKAGRFALIL